MSKIFRNSIVLLVLLLIGWVLLHGNSDDPTRDFRLGAQVSAGKDKKIESAEEAVEIVTRKRTREDLAPASKMPPTTVVPTQLHKLLGFFARSEAIRCRVVKESKTADATCYYLESQTPTLAEIREGRRLIAEALKSVSSNDKKNMDGWIEYLIDQYDPFGQSGKKLISIRVPDDVGKPLSAWYYSTENVSQEVDDLLGGKKTLAPADIRFYVSDNGESLQRFKNLIVLTDPQ